MSTASLSVVEDALTMTLQQAGPRGGAAVVVFGLSGTFTGATVAFEGQLSEDGAWTPLGAVNLETYTAPASSVALANSTKYTFLVPYVVGLYAARCRLTVVATGAVEAEAEARATGGSPLPVSNVSVATAAAQTATGDLTLASGADLTFSGTTGQSQVNVTDNLADALSVKVASGNDLIVLDSTDSAEKVYVGGSQAGQQVVIRPGTVGPSVKRTATTVSTAGAGTLTAAAVLGGIILRDPTGGDRTDTTHTAAQLVAALPGVAVGDTVEVLIVNTADQAETITLQGGSGVTLVPATVTIAQNEVYRGTLRFTNVTGSSEAATLYGGCSAG